MCVKGYPGGWTTEPYYNIYEEEWKGLLGLNKCLNTGPKSLSAQICSSDIQEEEKFLIHCPALHTSLFLYSSPFDNSSLSQAVIASNLCQLVAQLLSFLVGFQTPPQRRWGWEFGRGLILILTAQSQLLQTGSPRPRPGRTGRNKHTEL